MAITIMHLTRRAKNLTRAFVSLRVILQLLLGINCTNRVFCVGFFCAQQKDVLLPRLVQMFIYDFSEALQSAIYCVLDFVLYTNGFALL